MDQEKHEEAWGKSAWISIKSSICLPWFCLHLGGKKSLLVLDRFLHSFKASNLPHACHGSAYFLGGKKSLLVLDRFLYSFTASNLPHTCHLSSKFLGGRNASVLLTDSLPAGKGEAQGVFSCQHQNFFPTLGFLLSFLKKQKCLTLPQGFHPEDYPQAKNMLLFLVSWVRFWVRINKIQYTHVKS